MLGWCVSSAAQQRADLFSLVPMIILARSSGLYVISLSVNLIVGRIKRCFLSHQKAVRSVIREPLLGFLLHDE
jgi:hypothetical protein